MPNSKEINKSIKKAIDDNDLDSLKKFPIEQVKEFELTEDGMRAFFYACHKANYEIIRYITDEMTKYFATAEYKDEDGDNEERDDEFCDFFYESYVDEDDREYSPATLLLNRHEEGYEIFKYTDKILKYFENDELLQNLASPYGSTTFQGYIKDDIKKRKPRSFENERERQLLKHLSTLLFFRTRRHLEDVSDLVEIQTKHLRYNKCSHLFITGNKTDATKSLNVGINDFESLKTALSQKQKVKRDPEGVVRVKRYTENIKRMIYSDEISYVPDEGADNKRYHQIRTLLNDKKLKIVYLQLNYEKGDLTKETFEQIIGILNSKESKVIFVDTSQCKGSYKTRHAEEFLVDISEVVAKEIKDQKEKIRLHICVAGKKRPCITCFGRMKNFNNNNDTKIKFGQHPGLIWSGAIKSQDVDSATESIKTLALIDSCVTINKKKQFKPDYDSGTDDELDKEFRFTKK